MNLALNALIFFALALPTQPVGAEVSINRMILQELLYGENSDWTEIERVTYEILHTFPPHEYLYVGVGRGPVPIIASLQVHIGDQAAMNLPLSEIPTKGMSWRSITADLGPISDRLKSHLAHFFPSPPTKKILLIDFTLNGASIVFARAALSQHLPKENIEALSLIRSFWVERRLRNVGIKTLRLSRAFEGRLFSYVYGKFSEFPRFLVSLQTDNPDFNQPLPAYEQLKMAMRVRISEGDPFESHTKPCESKLLEIWPSRK